ncbi:GPN-loop GTPase 2 [Tanacetum coccineum]
MVRHHGGRPLFRILADLKNVKEDYSSNELTYQFTFIVPEGEGPLSLNLASMGKGQAWVNGQNIGRYHILRTWVNPGENLLVLHEVLGGNSSKIFVMRQNGYEMVYKIKTWMILYCPCKYSFELVSYHAKLTILLLSDTLFGFQEELRAPQESQQSDAVMESIVKKCNGSVMGKGLILKIRHLFVAYESRLGSKDREQVEQEQEVISKNTIQRKKSIGAKKNADPLIPALYGSNGCLLFFDEQGRTNGIFASAGSSSTLLNCLYPKDLMHQARKVRAESQCCELLILLTAIHLIDSHLCSDPGKYVSALLLTLSTMLHMELPHVNVLSKMDLIESYEKLAFNLDFYMDDKESVTNLVKLIDKTSGYIFHGIDASEVEFSKIAIAPTDWEYHRYPYITTCDFFYYDANVTLSWELPPAATYLN